MNLFKLPPYHLLVIFQDWILLKEICFLDSAFCNKKFRKECRHILSVSAKLIAADEHSPFTGFLLMLRIDCNLRWFYWEKYVIKLIDHTQWDILNSLSDAGLSLKI